MQLARVIGNVVVTRKDQKLHGLALLLIQPLNPKHEPVGRPLVAADAVGAGTGEEVFFVRGKEAAFPFYPVEPPVDAGIVGIVDHWTVETMNWVIESSNHLVIGTTHADRTRCRHRRLHAEAPQV